MKTSIIKQIAAILILVASLPLCSRAQTMSGGIATPAANSVSAGPIRYSFRIGSIGYAKVGKMAYQPQENTGSDAAKPAYSDLKPAMVSAYPNPFAEEIRLQFPIKENAGQPTIQIIDPNGKMISANYTYQEADGKGQATLSGLRLAKGKYIIRIITGGCIYSVSTIKI